MVVHVSILFYLQLSFRLSLHYLYIKKEGYLIVSLFPLSCRNRLWRLLICSGETAEKH